MRLTDKHKNKKIRTNKTYMQSLDMPNMAWRGMTIKIQLKIIV